MPEILTWAGFDALKLEDDAARVVVIPQLGAKIVSLYDKRAGREWLIPPARPLRRPPSAATFTECDVSGWDEMFPTIDACAYPAPGRSQGAPLPDHGEVWRLPWTAETPHTADPDAADSITLAVRGRVLPAVLRRRISLPQPGVVRFAYRATNPTDEDLIFLWAAHPLLAVTPHTEILLAAEMMIQASDTPTLPGKGALLTWPVHDGHRLDRVGTSGTDRKLYAPPDEPLSWVVLHEPGASLRLEWSAAELPYMGLWVSEGVYTPHRTAAPEPSNGYYDSLALAWENRRYTTLKAGEALNWALTARFASP